MSNTAVFIHPDDNLSPVATGGSEWAAETGTVDADPDYGLTKLGDLDPGTPCKCVTAGPFAVVRDLGSAKRVDFAIVPMHSCDAGNTVKFQMHTANAWGGPDVTVDCVVPAWLRTYPSMPQGLIFDLRGVYSAGGRTRRWVRLSAPANGSGRVLSLGEIVFGVCSDLPRNINWGLRAAQAVPTIRNSSALGVRGGVRVGTPIRTVSGHTEQTDAGLTILEALYHGAADVVPFGFCLDPTVVDGRMVFLDSGFDPTLTFLDVNDLDLTFTEQSRGRPVV